MATILIVSRTQMQHGVCVGGINEDTGELIRIHNERGGNLDSDAPYEIGDRWNMNVEDAWNARERPHIEDKQTYAYSKINNVGISGIINYINSHYFANRLTRGSLENTFENCLKFEGKKIFIDYSNIPNFSTQFWIPDRDLVHKEEWGKHYYNYKNTHIKFVGYQNPVDRIPAGTIIRLSLANWWNGDGSGKNRCYLQLSGWYLPY